MCNSYTIKSYWRKLWVRYVAVLLLFMRQLCKIHTTLLCVWAPWSKDHHDWKNGMLYKTLLVLHLIHTPAFYIRVWPWLIITTCSKQDACTLKGSKTLGRYFQTSSNQIPLTIDATYKTHTKLTIRSWDTNWSIFYRSASVANDLASARTWPLLILFQLPTFIEYRLFSILVLRVLIV